MKRQLLHTPEGVRDIYNEECKKKQVLQGQMTDAMERFGYRMIQTPTFEFFDVFGKEIGTTPSKDLYKFFDREGNTLVLRPDITPSVARAVAKYFGEWNMPIRLYYLGNTFINNSSYQGRMKEATQLGAELIGDNSVEADAEMISMAVECLLASGLKEFQLSVGHAGVFKGLIEAAGFDEDMAGELRGLIANKNYFGLEEALSKQAMEADLRGLFSMLGGFYFSADEIARARALAAGYPEILSAIVRLEELHKALQAYHVDAYVSYEPGMVSGYEYYTGIIFAGYTFGSGEPILKGGRYDKLLSHFGKNAASIGFVIVVDQLMSSLGRQGIEAEIPYQGEVIVYVRERFREAAAHAMEKRGQGMNVELIRKDASVGKAEYEAYARQSHWQKVTFLE